MWRRPSGAYPGVVRADRYRRATEKIGRIARESSGLAELWRRSSDVLATTVPFFWTPCYYTLDPASLLVTSHFHDGMPTFPAEWLAEEYYGDDVHQLITVATSPTGLSTLHDATDGRPQASVRWQRNMTMGGDQELILRLRTRDGAVWGMLGLYREPDTALFTVEEKAFLTGVAATLAEGVRRALLLGEAAEPDHPDAPGLLIIDQRWQVRSRTPGVDRWLAEISADAAAGRLPPAVLTVAGRALRAAAAAEPDGVATARVRARGGGWLVLHGVCLEDDGERRVAVIIEAAHPARLYPLLMAAYKLTERERDVTEQVLQGNATTEIAKALGMTTSTVQQHLKKIFEKTGVRSRRDLIGHIFFAHYEPRFRDNEHRLVDGRPVRGGPAATED
jgi:DNA-binding CsgD family transcriptional regulator